METKEIIRKLENVELSRIREVQINGISYGVDSMCIDYVGKNIYISAYEVDENNCILKYRFNNEDLEQARDVKFFALLEI